MGRMGRVLFQKYFVSLSIYFAGVHEQLLEIFVSFSGNHLVDKII